MCWKYSPDGYYEYFSLPLSSLLHILNISNADIYDWISFGLGQGQPFKPHSKCQDLLFCI